MMDIEVREESRPRRDDRGGAKGGRGRDRGRDGKRRDRRPPDGKFHDHVASMEPAETRPTAAPPAGAAGRAPGHRHRRNREQHRARKSPSTAGAEAP